MSMQVPMPTLAQHAPSTEPASLAAMRRLLLAVLMLGIAGMATELLLIGHVETTAQLVPLAALTCGFVSLAWLALAPSRSAVRTVQILMLAFVTSGIAGVVLHYRGNAEFEREIYPTLAGFELIKGSLTGATPVLAPGSMTLLGLVGLTAAFRHPSATGRSSRPGEVP